MLNRCTAYGLNALAGGCWFPSAEDCLQVANCKLKKDIGSVRKAYQLQRALPLPIGTQFCIQHRHGRLWNVSLVPQMTYGAYECREFVAHPMLIQIALALTTSTRRVAAMGKSAVTSGVGDANHLSVFLWRPREEDEGWVLIRPPGRTDKVSTSGLQAMGLRSATSMKLYSMGGYGPTSKDKKDSAYKNLIDDLDTTNENRLS